VVGSYFPDGIRAAEEVFESRVAVKTFYDIDTPITVATLSEKGSTEYLRGDQIKEFDVYFSFTGGPMLREIELRFKASKVAPLYCSFDPQKYKKFPVAKRYACEMSYMGTYAPDRQPKLEELLFGAAQQMPESKFLVAGPQYPKSVEWPANVRRIMHLNPRWHPHLYSSSRLTLNVTRRDMVIAGYSPSVRLFEAAACAAPIVSDNWPGLDSFFAPGTEILLPASSREIVRYLREWDPVELQRIGEAAQARVLGEHTSARRAQEFETAVEQSRSRKSERHEIVA
jgi:spore maturation protein CgeB